jgi:hypothetical protein
MMMSRDATTDHTVCVFDGGLCSATAGADGDPRSSGTQPEFHEAASPNTA